MRGRPRINRLLLFAFFSLVAVVWLLLPAAFPLYADVYAEAADLPIKPDSVTVVGNPLALLPPTPRRSLKDVGTL